MNYEHIHLWIFFMHPIKSQKSYLLKQQTPNPEAQEPEATPLLAVHSNSVKHDPVILSVVKQASLANSTMVKSLNTKINIIETNTNQIE